MAVRFLRIAIIVAASAAIALAAACKETSVSSDRLVVISPHPETLLEEFEAAFQTWYRQQTGRTVDCIWLDQGGTSKMLRYIYSEFERQPKGIGIDIVWGGGIEPYLALDTRNLLETYRLPEPILAKIPADLHGLRLYDPNHHWYATWLVGFGILYNQRVLELQKLPVPKNWEDLTNPVYFSWVGSADPRQSGSAHMAYEIILQAHGWEKGWEIITCMGANIKTFSRLASDPPRDTALGEIACGLCIDNYAYAQMAFTGRDILGYVMPEGLTVVNPDGIGILKGAPNEEVARRFIEYILTEPGQRLIMAPVGRFGGPRQFQIARLSVQPETYRLLGSKSTVPINPFEMKSSLQFDTAKASTRFKLVDDLIGALIVDNHDSLKNAWLTINRLNSQQRAGKIRQLAAMPLNEDEANRLAKTVWSDALGRNRELLKWSRFAREKYEKLVSE